MYYVYKITNSINDKVYVGRTIRSIEQRYKEHLQSLENGDTRHLYSAMRKYGANNFKIELIEECSTLDEMIEKEVYYCELLEAYTKGYNMTTAGEINPMECEKAKASHRCKMQSAEVKSKISETMKLKRLLENKLTMHRDVVEKRVPFTLVTEYLKNGWRQGKIKTQDPFYDGVHIRIYSKKEIKEILPAELLEYKNKGWKLSASSANNITYQKKTNSNNKELKNKTLGNKIKKIRLHKDNKETTIYPQYVQEYISAGWKLGGKPGRMSDEQKLRLAQSHKGMFDENFKKEQSIRLKEFYKNNPAATEKSEHPVKIINDKCGDIIFFKSCLDMCRELGFPESVARAGIVGHWVKLGYIKRKSSSYNGWKIYYVKQVYNKNE